MKTSWLAPLATLALALGSVTAASKVPGDVDLIGRGDYRAPGSGSAHVTRGSACVAEATGKIVSAALLADELLLELLPLARLGGVSYVIDSESSTPAFGRVPSSVPRVSGAAEDVLLLRPDAVILSDYTSGAAESQLGAAGVCVLRLRAPQTFEDLFAETLELGDATASRTEADALTLRTRARLTALRVPAREARRPRVLLVQDPYAYGPGTLQADCLRLIGLENVLGDGFGKTPFLNVEQLLSLEPDFVFFASDTIAPQALRDERRPTGAAWSRMRALEEGRAFEVPSSWMASISHHAARACEAYAHLVRGAP